MTVGFANVVEEVKQLNSDEKEHSKDVENSNPGGPEDSSKIDINV